MNRVNVSIFHPENDATFHDYGLGIVVSLSITMILCILLALIGNFLVIMTVIRHKGMRTRTNMFIVNLAVADILVAIFNMPFSLITVIRGRWIFGEPFCQFNGFVMALFFIVSIHTLMYISIHKYISITKPFSQTMTNRKILFMISIAWLWGGICGAFTLKIGNHVLYKKGSSQCGPSYPDELNEYIHSITITTFNYILPLVVMSYCYFYIFREIHEHMQRIRQTSNMDLQNTLNQQRRITCTLFSVLACFLVCWTPFIIYSCSAAFLKDKRKVPYIANPIGYWCGYMNSVCNPIIYALRSPSFRQGYKEIICHYKAYNMGGSLVTRRSLSPYGTLRKISSRISSAGLVNGVRLDTGKRKRASEKAFATEKLLVKGIVEKRSESNHNRKALARRMLTLSLQTGVNMKDEHPALNKSQSFYSTQSIINRYAIDENEALPSEDNYGRSRKPFRKRHSFPLSSDYQFSKEPICCKTEKTPLAICDNGAFGEPKGLFTSTTSTISKQTYQSSSADDESNPLSCPLVVIDAASLQSSTLQSLENREKSVSTMLPISGGSHDEWCGNHSLCSNLDDGKWSPMSTKSLEMGRCRSSSKVGKGLLTIGDRKAHFNKPESPLYNASKEQLMKWMSEDCLDRIQENVFTFGLRSKLFTNFKNITRHHKHAVGEFH